MLSARRVDSRSYAKMLSAKGLRGLACPGFLRPPQMRVYAMFFLYALALGGIFPRLGDIQLAMGIGEGALGGALIGIAVGTQIALMFGGPALQKFGHRAALLFCIPVLALAELAASQAPSPLILFATLLGAGLMVGTLEMVINLEADRTEHLLGKRIMNRAHAFWSFGFFTMGIIGGGAKQIDVGVFAQLLSVGLVVSIVAGVVFGDYQDAPARPSAQKPHPRFVRPSMGILAIVAFTLSAMLMEGASIDWSVIYMRDVFGTLPIINGAAFALGALAMALTRYFADGFVDRFGAAPVARTMVLILGAGVLLVAFAPHPSLAIFGFIFIGSGGSVMFPLAMSAAAQMTDRSAQSNVASLAQLSFVTFLIAPPLLGYVAEHFGIRVSFGLGLPLVVLSWFMLFTLDPANKHSAGEPN